MAIIDVIKYEGGNETLVWKHPREDYNAAAQLIVHETQEAIVFSDGQASKIYLPGKYTLQSDNSGSGMASAVQCPCTWAIFSPRR